MKYIELMCLGPRRQAQVWDGFHSFFPFFVRGKEEGLLVYQCACSALS